MPVEDFADMLAVGGRSNSLGRAAEVLAAAREDPRRLDELVDCVGDQDAWVRMRAVDCLEKVARVEPGLVQPFLGRILSELCASDQPSVQWHVAQMMTELVLTEDQRDRAVAWLRARLATTDVDWIVAAESMRALTLMGQAGAVSAADVASSCRVQLGHRSASVRRKAAALLDR